MPAREYVGLRISNDAQAVPTINDMGEGELAFNLASERMYARFGDVVRDITDSYTRAQVDQMLTGKAAAQHGHTWDEIDEKPSTYPPATHGHEWQAIGSKPATATRWPLFAEVSDKPATYPASAHTHALSEITDAGTAAGADVADFDPAGTAASEAYSVRRYVDSRPDPLLMHFL